ncbi:MAG: hypothetical protein ACOY3I_04920 [Verrucomicrobiota bacterium]
MGWVTINGNHVLIGEDGRSLTDRRYSKDRNNDDFLSKEEMDAIFREVAEAMNKGISLSNLRAEKLGITPDELDAIEKMMPKFQTMSAEDIKKGLYDWWFKNMAKTLKSGMHFPDLKEMALHYSTSLKKEKQGITNTEALPLYDRKNPNISLGLESNNPGNLKAYGQPIPSSWNAIGKMKCQWGYNIVFNTLEDGYAAEISNLKHNYWDNGQKTVRAILHKWSPPGKENPTWNNYMKSVANKLNVSPDAKLNLFDSKGKLTDQGIKMLQVMSWWESKIPEDQALKALQSAAERFDE